MIDAEVLDALMESMLPLYRNEPLFFMSAEMAERLQEALVQSLQWRRIPRKLRKCHMRKMFKRRQLERRRYGKAK